MRYEDLVADIGGSVERIYGELDLDDYAPVVQQVAEYIAAQRDYQPNRHQVDEALRVRIAECGRDYAAKYGYES
jgi:hypothetical protein